MSEDAHFSGPTGQKYFQCTCCGVVDYTPTPEDCGCSPEFCRVCHRCCACCKSPGEHFRISYLARTEADDEADVLAFMDDTIRGNSSCASCFGPRCMTCGMCLDHCWHVPEQCKRFSAVARVLTVKDMALLWAIGIRADEDITDAIV